MTERNRHLFVAVALLVTWRLVVSGFASDQSLRAGFSRLLRRSIGLHVLFVALMATLPNATYSQVVEEGDWPSPLLDEEPFDLIYLNRRSDNAIIKIIPVENLKQPLPTEGTLRFEFREDSEFILQVAYENIDQYVTFNQLLLEEAESFVEQRDYASALRNLLHVYDNGGSRDEELRKRLQNVLYKDAVANLEDGNFELSLSIFEDLYRKDPNLSIRGAGSIKGAIERSYDGLLQKKFDDGQAESIKLTLNGIESQYGEVFADFVSSWRKRFEDQALQVLEDARQAAAAGDGRKAHYLSRLAERINPGLDEARAIQVEITKQFPLIVVAVGQPAGDANPNRLDHWGSRRVGRLTRRTLIELAGLGDEGGIYNFLNGRFERVDNVGLTYAFIIDEQTDSLTPTISANQLSSRLLDHANDKSPNYIPAWAKIVEDISVENSRVIVRFRKPFVRPAALARFQYADRSADGQAEQNGAYAMTSKSDRESTFEFNSAYSRDSNRQHPVIVEEYYRSPSDAVDALLRGQVDVVDRPGLADLSRLRNEPGIEVRAYSVPTVHFLVPRIRGDYSDSMELIRSLSAGINRDGIVGDVFGGREIDGCQPVSGPFPVGSDDYDQVSYGYDFRIKPLTFQPRLSMVLAALARTTKTRKFPEGRQAKPELVLAHPAGSRVAIACANMKQNWEASGIGITLRELDESVSYPDDENWDLLYVEAAIEEPLTDAARIMGYTGIARDVSPPVEQSLLELGYSSSWQRASRTLRRIHRQVSNDLSVIPLYQIKEHYAFRKNVYGIGRDLIHLYQNVFRWKIEGYAEEVKAVSK